MNINYYNPYVREELMLYHHGVLGQKWGKQNGPPYPLAAGAHSASEKKAGWKKSLSGGIQLIKVAKQKRDNRRRIFEAARSKVADDYKVLSTDLNKRTSELNDQKKEYGQSIKDYKNAKKSKKSLSKGIRLSNKQLRKSRRALNLQKKVDRTDKQKMRDLKLDVESAKFRKTYAKIEYKNAVKALDKAKAKRKAEKALVKIRRKTLWEADRELTKVVNKKIEKLDKLYDEAPFGSERREEIQAAIDWYMFYLVGEI